MNMSFPSREQVASIRKNYPLGTRVMLNNILNTGRKANLTADTAA